MVSFMMSFMRHFIRGDYIELVNFEKSQIEDWLEQAKEFVDTIGMLSI